MRFYHLKLINLLRIIWIALVLLVEIAPFKYSSFQCRWPQLPNPEAQKHILLVADPQIPDRTSYADSPYALFWIIQTIVDINLRKSWRWVALNTRPDVVIFLGDMMDSGRLPMDYSRWYRYLVRFGRIFYMDQTLERHFIPGNHDIGIGNHELYGMHQHKMDWYKKHFGDANTWSEIGGHIFVFLDAPLLADEDNRRREKRISMSDWSPEAGGTMEFIRRFSDSKPTGPVILATHIPLFRQHGTSCGPLREKGNIQPGGGVGYENTLGRDVTQFLFTHISPSLVFSGDDHDYCEAFHRPITGDISEVKEVTVKSISMVMNVRKPAIQLLTVNPSQIGEARTFDDTMCLLPDQIWVYLVGYVPFALLSITLIAMDHWPARSLRIPSLPLPSASYDNHSFKWRSFTRHVLYDIRDVAVFPLVLFLFISFWVLSS